MKMRSNRVIVIIMLIYHQNGQINQETRSSTFPLLFFFFTLLRVRDESKWLFFKKVVGSVVQRILHFYEHESKWLFFKKVLLRCREQCTPNTNFPSIFLFGPSGGSQGWTLTQALRWIVVSRYTFYKFTTRQPEPSSGPRLKPVRACGPKGKSQSWAYAQGLVWDWAN